MSIGSANNMITSKRADLYGKLDRFSSNKSKAIENAKQSYKEKYGDASIFDVAKAQKGISTDAAQAQTATQQTQMQNGGTDNLANAIIKLNSVIAGITESFYKIANDIKQSIYKLSTQEAGAQPADPKDNIASNNQGTETNTKPKSEENKNPFEEASEKIGDVKDDEGEEPKSSSQIDQQFMQKLMMAYNQQYQQGTQTIEQTIGEIEEGLAGAAGAGGPST